MCTCCFYAAYTQHTTAYIEYTLPSSLYTVYGNHSLLGILLYQTQRVWIGILSSFSLAPVLICTAHFCHLEAEGSPWLLLLSPSILLVLLSCDFFNSKTTFSYVPLLAPICYGKITLLTPGKGLRDYHILQSKNSDPKRGEASCPKAHS